MYNNNNNVCLVSPEELFFLLNVGLNEHAHLQPPEDDRDMLVHQKMVARLLGFALAFALQEGTAEQARRFRKAPQP